ncbi:uncharacterized protein LTR77_002580 [Saxophila tyrrhenica]|uniref:Uncharacterized protein n=1 Tax=Saxophila tyrrhenica TaxID=1690608 RepID=A0AAV9PJM9_9PEZI|nr:hypothetical protein LTR77_002580 [Saxophila tyrrhenica]
MSRFNPHHIQEIHLQIQDRPAYSDKDYHHGLHRRQLGTATLESIITTVDAAGSTILSTVTNLLPTVTPTATSTTPTDTAATTAATTSESPDGIIGSGTDTAGTGAEATSTSADSNSTTPTQTGSGTSQTASASTLTNSNTNGTATHRQTDGSGTGTRTTSRTSLRPVILATLSNGDVQTITRSNKPYITTLSNGQRTTVCDRQGDCRVSTKSNNNDNNNDRTTYTPSFSSSSAAAQNTISSSAFVPGINVGQSTTAAPSSTSSASSSSSSSSNNDDSTPPAGTIAGGVVGGAAGLAVILLIALVFLRWYKRRRQQGHQALPPSSAMSPADDDPTVSRSGGPGMAERAGLMPLAAAVPALFRHSNRSSEVPSSERGFTRVSGRKLPSQFSEGMSSPGYGAGGIASPGFPHPGSGPSSPPPNMPLAPNREQNFSSQSFYRDSNGFYGGPGTGVQESPPDGPTPESEAGPMEIALSPGPRRTPTVHTGGPYVMSPSTSVPATPVTPTARDRAAMGMHSPTVPTIPQRSGTPASTYTDERSSRFTEEV